MATTSIQAGNLFSVNGLVAVITGGGSGIGLMMARALALNGAHKVYIVGRRKEVLESAAASVDTKNIIPLVGDVTSKAALQSIVETIEADVGYINVLIANSGIFGPSFGVTPETSFEDFQKGLWATEFDDYANTFSVNTAAAWFSIVAFLGLLNKGNEKGNVEQKSQVIATTSIAGFNRNSMGAFAYGQSKAATTHMMKQLATSMAPYGIRSNIIAPGLYPSDMGTPIINKSGGEFKISQVPLQRAGTEEDMAGLILYLTSRAGGYVTGTVLLTDGGRLSVNPAVY